MNVENRMNEWIRTVPTLVRLTVCVARNEHRTDNRMNEWIRTVPTLVRLTVDSAASWLPAAT